MTLTLAKKVEELQEIVEVLTKQNAEVNDKAMQTRNELEKTVADLVRRLKTSDIELGEAGIDIQQLKNELLAEKILSARQAGYIDRVIEDDGIREDKMTTKIGNISEISVPTRKGPGLRYTPDRDSAFSGLMSTTRTVKKSWQDL